MLASDNTTETAPLHWINYDAAGREIYTDTESFSDPYSRVAYIYDANGNLNQQSNPYFWANTPAVTTNVPDELGRFVQINHPDGLIDRINFDGQTVATTNGLGQTANIYEDGHGNVSWSQDSLGNKITFNYDGFDQRTKVTDVAGNITSYVYDIRGRAVSGIDPDKGAWTAAYNSLGELIGTTDANEAARGQTTSMAYDLLGRMVQRVEPDLTSNWTFDIAQYGVGELASETASGVASPSGQAGVTGYTKTYTYDTLGRLHKMSFQGPASGPVGAGSTYPEIFAYNAAGQPYSFQTNWDQITTNYNGYGYKTGEVQTATGTPLWTVTARDAAGSVTSATYGAGPAITQNFGYDPNTERTVAVAATGPGSATLESANYAYDYLGNVTNKTINPTTSESTPLTEWYSYDGLNRLCTVNAGGSNRATLTPANQSCVPQPGGFYPGLSMAYASTGNIQVKTDVGSYIYPASGHPLPHAVQSIYGTVNSSFTYDANGNMLSGNGRGVAYTSFDKVQSVTQNGKTISFAYDAEHDRMTQVNPEIKTLYLPDLDITFPGGPNGNELHTYFRDTAGNAAGEIDRTRVSYSSNGTPAVKFYLNDWQNSVSTITDVAGNVLEADSYDAWGKRRNLNGSADVNDTIASQTIHGYTNQEHLQDVQLIDLNARMYDPYLATMLSVDPAVANWLDPQTFKFLNAVTAACQAALSLVYCLP